MLEAQLTLGEGFEATAVSGMWPPHQQQVGTPREHDVQARHRNGSRHHSHVEGSLRFNFASIPRLSTLGPFGQPDDRQVSAPAAGANAACRQKFCCRNDRQKSSPVIPDCLQGVTTSQPPSERQLQWQRRKES